MLQLLRSNRDIRILFAAQVVSFMGDWFAFVALAGLVDDATGSALLVALVFVSFSLPSFLLSPIGGPVADRFDRRKVLVMVSAAQALAALGLLLANDDRIWAVFVFQGAVSGLAAFVKPAVDAAVPNLARTPDELRLANALLGSTWGVMLAVGAALGGLFSDAFGRNAAFMANAASFVLAGVLFAMIRTPMQQRASTAVRAPVRPIADMHEAIRFARKDPVVLALMASKATFAIGAGVVGQLAVLASDVFGAGDRGRGALIAARGVGSGLGPILAARFTRGDLRRVLLVCGAAGVLFSVSYVGVAWAPALALAALGVAVAHTGGGAQWMMSTYGLQLRAPDDIRGRVMAGDFAIVTLVLSLTSIIAGLLSEAVGVRWSITICAGAAGLAGTVYLVVTRNLRTSAS
jgi:MFS family permease